MFTTNIKGLYYEMNWIFYKSILILVDLSDISFSFNNIYFFFKLMKNNILWMNKLNKKFSLYKNF